MKRKFLKKSQTSNEINNSSIKDSISLSKLQTIESHSLMNSKRQLKYSYILPQLNKSFKKKDSFNSNSLLAKFIHNKTLSLKKLTNKDLYKKIEVNYISPSYSKNNLIKIRKLPYFNRLTKSNLESKSHSTFITDRNNSINDSENSNNNKIIGQRNKQEKSFKDEKDKEKEKDIFEYNPTKSIPSSIRVTNPISVNNDFNTSEVLITSDNNNNYLLSSSRPTKNNKLKPITNKLSIKKDFIFSNYNIHRLFFMDIGFQSKIFNEQNILVEENIKNYRSCIQKENCYKIFKSMKLDSKNKFNKKLKEINEILLFLPTIILGNYYKLLCGLKEIKIPIINKDEENTEDCDIIEKIDNNNKLLYDINIFFKKSFDFYLILKTKNDIDDLVLNKKDYKKVLSYYEIVRNNFCDLVNSYSNAEKKYEEDFSIIKKILSSKVVKITKEDSLEDLKTDILNDYKKRKENQINAMDRIKQQFLYKANNQVAKEHRLDYELKGLNDKKIKNEKRNKKNHQYKSVFNTKIMDKVLNYCDEQTKTNIISTQLKYEGKKSYQKQYKPIKIHL